MTGVAAFLVGALPRFAPFAWGVLLVTFMLTEIGPLTKLPSWLVNVSPFTHLSPLPGGQFEVGLGRHPDPPGPAPDRRRLLGLPPPRRHLTPFFPDFLRISHLRGVTRSLVLADFLRISHLRGVT